MEGWALKKPSIYLNGFLLIEVIKIFGNDKKYPDLPVIIAGDMNTFTYADNDDDEAVSDMIRKDGDNGRFRRENPDKWETLFDFMEGRGYDYRNCNQENKISCRDHIDGLDFLLEMNLDWFFTRGIKASEPSTVTTIFNSEELQGFKGLESSNGTEMTDHNILSIYMEKDFL